jgi:alpha-1,6-mannosyltransferase
MYVPFAVRGSSDAASMMTFASGWEFNSFAFAILRTWLGATGGRIAGMVLFSAFYLWWLRKNAGVAMLRGDLLLAALFLFSPVVNPWYLVLLVPFLALQPGWWGIAAVTTVLLAYCTAANLQLAGLGGFDHPAWVRPLEIGPVLVAAAIAIFRRVTYHPAGAVEAAAREECNNPTSI